MRLIVKVMVYTSPVWLICLGVLGWMAAADHPAALLLGVAVGLVGLGVGIGYAGEVATDAQRREAEYERREEQYRLAVAELRRQLDDADATIAHMRKEVARGDGRPACVCRSRR